MRPILAAALFALSLHAAVADGAMMDDARYNAFLADSSERFAAAAARIAGLSKSDIVVQLTEKIPDRTRVLLQQGHGIYLEYTDKNGRLFMWYPGNRRVVIGTWAIVDTYSPPRVCFKYTGAYHGVTGEYEPNECVPPAQIIGEVDVLDQRAGDPFNLSSGNIPYAKQQRDIPAWPN